MSTYEIIKIQKPRHRKKLAMFDMDWTLIKPTEGRKFPKDISDWEWLRPSVPEKVKSYYEKGYAIAIFTNQSKSWKRDMIVNVLTSLNIPCTAVIAFDKSYYKPDRRMFDAFIGKHDFDTVKSFFVGDALGRASDFADSDKKFAEAIGVKVMSPEDIFPFPKRIDSKPKPRLQPSSVQEVVIMVGYPGSGKSTLAKQIFGSSPNYVIIDGDTHKTSAKMIKLGQKAIKEGKSVVFDATNGSKERRAEYITLARENCISARCIHMNTTMEESLARNNARSPSKVVPKVAFYTYRKRFEQPNSDEGCMVVTI